MLLVVEMEMEMEMEWDGIDVTPKKTWEFHCTTSCERGRSQLGQLLHVNDAMAHLCLWFHLWAGQTILDLASDLYQILPPRNSFFRHSSEIICVHQNKQILRLSIQLLDTIGFSTTHHLIGHILGSTIPYTSPEQEHIHNLSVPPSRRLRRTANRPAAATSDRWPGQNWRGVRWPNAPAPRPWRTRMGPGWVLWGILQNRLN